MTQRGQELYQEAMTNAEKALVISNHPNTDLHSSLQREIRDVYANCALANLAYARELRENGFNVTVAPA